MPHLSYLTLTLIIMGVYFVWMDVALYTNLQRVDPLNLNEKETENRNDDPTFSPFHPLTIKLLFQGPTIHYIDEPLAYWTVAYTNVASILSADQASMVGLVLSLGAAYFFTQDSFRARQFGVLLFKVRDYMDSLDGCIAREQRKEARVIPVPGTFGYLMDGVCDAFADIFMYIAVVIYFYKNNFQSSKLLNNGILYSRLETKPEKLNWNSKAFWKNLIPVFLFVMMVAGQTIAATVSWNMNMVKYHVLLETDLYAQTPVQFLAQNQALKSPSTWITIYFMRLFNPHSLNQFLLLSILYNKTYEYFHIMRYWGYLPVIIVTIVAYINANVILAHILSAGG